MATATVGVAVTMTTPAYYDDNPIHITMTTPVTALLVVRQTIRIDVRVQVRV